MDRLKLAQRLARPLVLATLSLLAGCPRAQRDAPPPAESLEISSAAPGALGALAGGTDAAPPVGVLRRNPSPDDPFGLQQPEELEQDGGTDGGGAEIEAPENVPL
jgi:hypothetical protein